MAVGSDTGSGAGGGHAYAGHHLIAGREPPMTTPHARRPQIPPSPACSPAAIRAVLAASADTAVLQSYD